MKGEIENKSEALESATVSFTKVDPSEVEKDIAKAAQNDFTSGNYIAALMNLNKLESSRSHDIKVLLNVAVAGYYKSDLTETDIFERKLAEISAKAGFRLQEIENADHGIIHLNYCLLLYHKQQYYKVTKLLRKMYTNLESYEENVGIEVCLLLTECLLACNLPVQAIAIVAHTEATYLPQPLPPAPSPKMLHQEKDKSPEKIPTGNGNNSNSTGSISSSSSSSSSSCSNDVRRNELRCSAGQEQLRYKLQLLRLRALLMMRLLRVTKKELKSVVTQASNAGNQLNIPLVMLKSQLELLRGNKRKAVKVINQCEVIPAPSQIYSPVLSVAYYNNLGVIHQNLRKPTIACLYLQRALEELVSNDSKKGSSRKSLYMYTRQVLPDLYYNLGVTLLHMNKPKEAFEFLLKVAQVCPQNPRLWLRLAECCILQHKQDIQDFNMENLKKSTRDSLCGTGVHRKICLVSHSSDSNKSSLNKSATDPSVDGPTLEFSSQCLQNALLLIPESISTTLLTDEQEASGVLPDVYAVCPSVPARGQEMLNIKLSVLASLSYVSLCLKDYTSAFRYAEMLLAVHTKIPPIYKLCGHLYAGEASVGLGRINEALTHFDPRHVADMVPAGETSKGTSMDYPAAPSMKYNLSVAYAIRGEFEKANSLLKEVWDDRSGTVAAHVVMLAMYIQLQLGNADVIATIVRRKLLIT